MVEEDNIILDCQGSRIRGIGYNPNDTRTRFRFGIFGNKLNNITVRNCIVEGFADGILLIQTTNSSFYNNTLIGNDNGLVIDNTIPVYWETFERGNRTQESSSGYNHVYSNTFYDNYQSINLLFSNENWIYDNTVNHSRRVGVQLENSLLNMIFGNTFLEAPLGALLLDGSNDNNFFNNRYYNMEGYAELFDSHRTIVFNNTPSFNGNQTFFSPNAEVIPLNSSKEQNVVLERLLKLAGDHKGVGRDEHTCFLASLLAFLSLFLLCWFISSRIRLKNRRLYH